MGRTLKMGFAMGGGVSLGSFSGAGLSEAIKQAVLNAGYTGKDPATGKEEFKQYSRIEVDVFSGASAGSMALAIMLRGLAHQTDKETNTAIANLKKEGIDPDGFDPERRKALITAQVVHDLQRQIWVKEINLDRLLGTTATQKAALRYEANLLRRGALEDIARRYFQLDDAYASGFGKRSILGRQVLFASTLSNLTGIVYDIRDGKAQTTNPNYAGTRDPYTSKCHKELRVFHLLFNEVSVNDIEDNPEKYPSKWIRYHTGPRTPNRISDLRSKTAWSRIVSTSIACGAFPFAFEPVPLERFQFEYDKGCWPSDALTPDVCRLAMEADEPQPDGELSYPFCYVDGGTFNNEPVREAFRLAAFQDAEDTSDFDRVIVFVDPSVGDTATNFNTPFLKQFSVREPRKLLGSLDGYDVVQNGTLDRLLPHVGTLLSMIIDEGRVKESNKIMQVSRLFKAKDDYYNVFETLLNAATDIPAAIAAVLKPVQALFETRRASEVVPSGALTLKGELIRVCKDKNSPLAPLMQYQDDFEAGKLQFIPQALQPLLLKALLRIFMDGLMDLSGKDPEYKIMAIAPEELVDGVYKGLELPGSPLAAFSGFASERANEYAIDLAIYCTRQLMKELKMLPTGFNPGRKPLWTDKDQAGFIQSFKAQLSNINDRIDGLFDNTHLIDIFFGVDRLILRQLSKLVRDYIAHLDLIATRRYSFRFMVEVKDKRMEIDGSGTFNDAASVMLDGKLQLITELYYYPGKKDNLFWNGVHAQNDCLVIDKDGFSILPDRSFCAIELPTANQVHAANLMPNPTFIYRCLNDGDKGKKLPGKSWQIKPGIRLPEKTLLD